jgi:hypothetical protein
MVINYMDVETQENGGHQKEEKPQISFKGFPIGFSINQNNETHFLVQSPNRQNKKCLLKKIQSPPKKVLATANKNPYKGYTLEIMRVCLKSSP